MARMLMFSTMLMVLLAVLMGCTCTPHSRDGAGNTSQEEENKRIVLDFYDKAINQKDFEAAKVHFGNRYTQHNPMAADGPEGLKSFIEWMKANIPQAKAEFLATYADGDFVIVHCRFTPSPDARPSAVIDVFKLENGKVVEHWDVIQEVPEKSANKNTMFP